MATEGEEGPEVARDGLLRGINELRAFDVSGIIAQLLLELPADARAAHVTWETIIGKLTSRQYTTYAALHSDVLAATGVLAIPDKKRSKLQKACGKILKDMRKAWHAAEVKTRMQLFEWHPGGPTKAHEDEVAHLSACERHIADFRARSRKAQIYHSFIDHPAPKMAEMGEMAVARLQATQHVTSTNDFEADTLAVHSALAARLPHLSHYAPGHMHVPEDAALVQPSTILSQMPAATVVHTAGGAVASIDDPDDHPPPPRQVNNTPSQPWRVLRRATEWKSRWLHLRILDLAFQESQLKDAIARHTEQQATEMRAASHAATLAKAPAPDPLYEPVPDAHVQRAGFAPADLEQHAFFREALGAAAAGDPDALSAGDGAAVQDDSDGEVTLAELAVAFGGLHDRATELDVYLKNELHNTGATTMRAPSKIAPRKGVRPGRGSVAAFAGRRSSSDQTREPPKKRRTDAHHPMLPESLVAQLKAPRQKGGGSGGVYVPMARRLDPEEVQAQMDAESSGEDDVSDAFYIELHAAAQKRAEAEREGRERANAERDPLARRQSMLSPSKPVSNPQLTTQKSAPAGIPHLSPQKSTPALLTSPRPPATAPANVLPTVKPAAASGAPTAGAARPAAPAAASVRPLAAAGAAAPTSAASPSTAGAAAAPPTGVAAESRAKAAAAAAAAPRPPQSGAVAAVTKSVSQAAGRVPSAGVAARPQGFVAAAAAIAAAAGIVGAAPVSGTQTHARGRQAAPLGASTAQAQAAAAPAAAANGEANKRGAEGKASEEQRAGKKTRTS